MAFVLTTWIACTMPPSPSDYPGSGSTDDVIEPVPGLGLELYPGDLVAYAGRFDWEDALLEDGSYTFTNNLGNQFRIDALYLATSSIQLRSCAVVEESSWLTRWGVAMAYADHVVEDDPSLVLVGKTEDAFADGVRQLGVGVVTGGNYCEAFARSATLPEPERALGQNTLVVVGAYTFAGNQSDEGWSSFDASVTLTEGMLEELELDPEPTWRADDVDASVVFTRYPVRAFRSIDPRGLLPVELAWEILGNLLHSSTVRYHTSSD